MYSRKKSLRTGGLFIVFGLLFIYFLQSNTIQSVVLKEKTFLVTVADTENLREQGLSGKTSLLPEEGMLFVFQKLGTHSFWMKDMLFPIDIIWIDKNLKIVHMAHSLHPETYPKIFFPPSDSLYVLEVSAGEAEKLSLDIGDRVKLVRKYF